MKKILIYSPSYAKWGGGHIYIENLCQYLTKRGIDTLMITFRVNEFDCNTTLLPNPSSKIDRLLSAFKIAKEFKSKNYKIVLLNDLVSLWLAPIFWLYGYRVYSLLHLYLRLGDGKGLGHTPLQYIILKTSAFFCKKIFSVGRDNIDVFGQKRVVFVGNYVSKWFFEEIDKNSKEYDFLIVARFSKEKNIPLFLDLLYNLNRYKNKEYRALIVGEGEEKSTIVSKIKSLHLDKSVELRGWIEREKLPHIYDSAKVFVISSYHEGFATTLLEAHARGLPAIVTKTSGFCVDFIKGYGSSSGVVFKKSDINSKSFLDNTALLIEEFDKYFDICQKKASVFTKESVLGKIAQNIN